MEDPRSKGTIKKIACIQIDTRGYYKVQIFTSRGYTPEIYRKHTISYPYYNQNIQILLNPSIVSAAKVKLIITGDS